MYPFERFSEAAKRVLTLAQEESERAHHSYIGTEHILLGLLRVRDTVAGEVLDRLGINIADARRTVQTVLGAHERIVIQQIIPTSRVKTVIEISFEEARRMGDVVVGTEHLLLGLLVEGEGVAAHVLEDLGANLEQVRTEVESVRKAGTIVGGGETVESSTGRAFTHGDLAAPPPGGLRFVLFERVGKTTADSGPVYVNPADVVAVAQMSEDRTSITLRHNASSTLVVRGAADDVARRLTQA